MGVGDDGTWEAWSRDFAEGREPEGFWPALLDELRPLAPALLRGRPHEWEDALQEAVLSLLEVRASGRFDPSRGTVAALAARIVRRRCVDRLRAGLDPVPGEVADPQPDPQPDPEEAMIESVSRRERRTRFAEAIHELRRQDERLGSCRAQAVLLRHRGAIVSDDWSFLGAGPGDEVAPWKEVAERLHISVEAARQNGSRGLRVLREILAAQPATGEERP